jgi:RimJ/RimL family protein N-acetyltransferase
MRQKVLPGESKKVSDLHDDFAVRPLYAADASALSSMLLAQTPAYVRFFTPFDFRHPSVVSLLAAQREDVFMGMYRGERLAGFFMLRGWDDGFEIPSYGVLVDERYSGYGLTRLSLKLAKSICKLRRAPRIMLKVNPDNKIAKRLFEEAGYAKTGVDAQTGNLVYHLDLDHH